MLEFSDFKNGDVEAKKFLPKEIRKLFALAKLDCVILDEDHFQLQEADDLIDATFPAGESEEYKPTNLISDENTFCLAINKDGIVIACATVSLCLDDQTASLHSIAVDESYREKKIGSLLMLCLNEILLKFGMTSISLISSGYGELFYKSFGFIGKAMRSYDASIPFEENIVDKKIKAFRKYYKDLTSKRGSGELEELSIFAKSSKKAKTVINKVQKQEFNITP